MSLSSAGMGWPNGPTTNAVILALPSHDLLMLGSEHWHYDQAVRAGKRVLFRGMARQGFRPAELGWDARRYVDEITRDAVRVSEPITDFVAWNELNLQDERGDTRPDHGDLNDLYELIGGFTLAVLTELRLRPVTRNARLHFGAFAPKDETDYVKYWRPAAEAADVVNVHAYGHGTGIVAHIEKYRALFPGRPIWLTEWHSDGGSADMDHETLALLANEAAVHDLTAHYFLWRWNNPPAHQQDLARAIAVEDNPARLALFLNPPVAALPAPEPEPIPMPKTREEVIAISNATADEVGIPRLLLLACGIAESNLVWDARRPKDPTQDASFWTDVSFGPWQQTVRWSQEYKDWYTNDAPGHHPNTFPGTDVVEAVFDHYRDTQHAARVAARQLKAHYRPGEVDAVARALARYNWPGGGGAFKSPAHEANYRRGIREAEAILGTSEPPPPPPGDLGPWPAVSYESHPIPAAGAFVGTPRGVVLHGSRSGAAGNSQDQEYRGTVNWAKNNPAGLGWNVTIADHRVAEHIDVEHWGHHAKSASRHYLSIEFAQPTVDRDITDAQADAAAHWIKTRVWPVWGELWHFPTHAEVQASGETGDAGNSDVYPLADPRLEVLRNRIYERLRQPLDVEPAPEPPPPSPSRAAVLVAEIEERLQELKELVA